MAQSQVTYTDKVENGGATNEGKCLATDLNELKTVVNANATDADADLFNRSFDGFEPTNGRHERYVDNIDIIDFNSSYNVFSVATGGTLPAGFSGTATLTTHLNFDTTTERDQTFISHNSITPQYYFRGMSSGNWSTWREIAQADDFVPIDTTQIKIGINAGATNQGTSAVAVGNQAGNDTQGNNSVAVGRLAGQTSQGNNSIAVGNNAGATSQDINSVAIGDNAGNDTQGNSSVAVGVQAGKTTQGNSSVAIGNLAGVTSQGVNAIAIGFQAGLTNQSANSVCLGESSAVTGTLQVQLGKSGTTTYAYGAVQDRSDERDKADIQGIHLGLDFIDALTPRSYKFDYREDYREHTTEMQEVITQDEGGNDVVTHEEVTVPDTRELGEITHDGTHKRGRLHCGLVAQEVKQVMDDLGVDFGGYQDHSINGGQDVLSIGYGELIAPLIKAVQELKARVEELENK